MASLGSIVFYMFIFLSVYVQVFFLLTFIENRKKIIVRKKDVSLSRYPTVSIVVPCWNEEKTIYKTVRSLLALNYPKDKLSLFLIDDGSTDSTWQILSKFSHYSNIQLFKKENGGKHSVLNLGLEKSTTDFVGCLDADSAVHPDALIRIMSHFELEPDSMAVVPSVTVHNARNVIQDAQRVEYHMGVYMKKMLDFLGAINVTPGPFTIFRKKVFNDLGPYRKAYNVEDMEIAYRMQTNNYKISHCYDAYVYTNTPATVVKLYKQRLRWIYGFINNTLDYRRALLNRKYGNFALFTLPTGLISIAAVGYLFGRMVYSIGHFIYFKIIQIQTVGFHMPSFNPNVSSFDPFFISINASLILVLVIYLSVMFAVMYGRYMSQEGFKPSIGMLYFLILFRVVAPFWILKAMYNTVMSRTPEWR
ncbi:MAG: glycosyltransferase family 2 protein [Candidatus Pacebacteria bacterium]|nr:glycosyltransferase family 2 protein [Candidatus Paceibacterota bacterium]